MKKNKIKIDKIGSVLKNVPLEQEVEISTNIKPQEGEIILVKAKCHINKKNDFELKNGRLGYLWEGDIIPAVVGYRKALVEFAGKVPKNINIGDNLSLLCESGLVGIIEGIFPEWGSPMQVEVLGSILGSDKRSLNLNNFINQQVKNKILFNNKFIPLIIFLSTGMDTGKTTMASKLIHKLKMEGKNIAAVKLTGVAFSQDLMKFSDAGANPTYDFVDMGLPSTCNNNAEQVIKSALNLLNYTKQNNPDFIFVEFGDGVLGEYHVADILQNPEFLSQVNTIILAARDFAGIKGTKDILSKWGLKIDLITGPVANSQVGINLIGEYFGLPAESNQGEINKAIEIISKKNAG